MIQVSTHSKYSIAYILAYHHYCHWQNQPSKYIIKHNAISGNNLIDSIVFSIQNENGNYYNYNYHFNPMQQRITYLYEL